jgi:hypothetical protein
MNFPKREVWFSLRRVLLGLALLAFFVAGALSIAPVRAVVCSASNGFYRDSNGLLCVTNAGTEPGPGPTSSPGGAQIIVPANASANPYSATNPLPVTTPPPFIPANPLPVTTPGPAFQDTNGAVRADACDQHSFLYAVTTATAFAPTLGVAPLHICEVVFWLISGSNVTFEIAAGGYDGVICHGGRISYFGGIPVGATAQQLGNNTGQLLSFSYNNADPCVIPSGTSPSIAVYITYDVH